AEPGQRHPAKGREGLDRLNSRRSTSGIARTGRTALRNPLALEEPHATLARSWDEMLTKTQANTEAWGLGTTDRWDADLDLGVIRFSNSGGLSATADVQVVGTYNLEDETWLWGWDHPSVSPPLARAALLARAFGEKHGLAQYTTRLIHCSQDE